MKNEDVRFYNNIYQPIYRLFNWDIHGYEVVFNTKNYKEYEIKNLEKESELLFKLEIYAFLQAITMNSLERNRLLFFSLSESTVLNKRFSYYIEKLFNMFSNQKDKIVIEVIDTTDFYNKKITNREKLNECIYILRTNQLMVGTGVDEDSDLRLLFQQRNLFNPEYIKLSNFLSKNLSSEQKKQQDVKKLLELYNGFSNIIMTGLENEKDLAIAKYIGIEFAQGSVLGGY